MTEEKKGTHGDYYKKAAQPPPVALKEIKGGRLAGFTDVKPQWRYEAITKIFGLCGFGWKYEITRQWSEPGSAAQLMCFCTIFLYVKIEGQWSDGIPGTGGSMLIKDEKKGLHVFDDGYKMALTDALGVAMQRIGIASDIYMGRWDGSKYDVPEESTKEEDPNKSTKGQRGILAGKMKQVGLDDSQQIDFYKMSLGDKEESVDWAADYIQEFEMYLFRYQMSEIAKAHPEEYKEALKVMGYKSALEVEEKDRVEVNKKMSEIGGSK